MSGRYTCHSEPFGSAQGKLCEESKALALNYTDLSCFVPLTLRLSKGVSWVSLFPLIWFEKLTTSLLMDRRRSKGLESA